MTTAPVIHITGITNVLNYVAHAVLYNCMYMLECVCGTCAPKWQNRSKEERKKGLSADACMDFTCCSIQKKCSHLTVVFRQDNYNHRKGCLQGRSKPQKDGQASPANLDIASSVCKAHSACNAC